MAKPVLHTGAREYEALPSGRTLGGLVRYFARLGSLGFGGPIALAGYMHRDLVEERRWFSDDEYQQGLAVSQTMPGPLGRSSPCGSATSSAAGSARSRSRSRSWSRRS